MALFALGTRCACGRDVRRRETDKDHDTVVVLYICVYCGRAEHEVRER